MYYVQVVTSPTELHTVGTDPPVGLEVLLIETVLRAGGLGDRMAERVALQPQPAHGAALALRL